MLELQLDDNSRVYANLHSNSSYHVNQMLAIVKQSRIKQKVILEKDDLTQAVLASTMHHILC